MHGDSNRKMASTRFCTVALIVLLTLNSFPQTESASCCLSYAKKIPKRSMMKGYTIQTYMGTCDMDAIIFHTKAGNFICADPSKRQTQGIIEYLNMRAKRLS